MKGVWPDVTDIKIFSLQAKLLVSLSTHTPIVKHNGGSIIDTTQKLVRTHGKMDGAKYRPILKENISLKPLR